MIHKGQKKLPCFVFVLFGPPLNQTKLNKVSRIAKARVELSLFLFSQDYEFQCCSLSPRLGMSRVKDAIEILDHL